jgi:hypothetical protein
MRSDAGTVKCQVKRLHGIYPIDSPALSFRAPCKRYRSSSRPEAAISSRTSGFCADPSTKAASKQRSSGSGHRARACGAQQRVPDRQKQSGPSMALRRRLRASQGSALHSLVGIVGLVVASAAGARSALPAAPLPLTFRRCTTRRDEPAWQWLALLETVPA